MSIHSKQSKFFGEDIHYPESDGKPMADNTIQAEWIINLYNNLHILFQAKEHILIAANLFWYPVEGNPNIRKAPDVMVVFDRPRAHRRSYRQWKEEGIAPQVVFEIYSDSNSPKEMERKRVFYEKYGCKEFVIIYPEQEYFTVYQSEQEQLVEVKVTGNKWQSPMLGIQLLDTSDGVKALYPDGSPFKTAHELQAEGQYYKEEAARQKEKAIAAQAEIERLKAKLKRLKGE